jgi:hypothetical protein
MSALFDITEGEFAPPLGHNRQSYSVDAGWNVPADFSYAEWLALGERLGSIDRATPWAIGDWWLLGGKYGERAAEVRKPTWKGPNYESCRQYAVVAKVFEPFMRINNLNFEHHQIVTSLTRRDMPAALTLLNTAFAEGWSDVRLRREVRRRKMRTQVAALPDAPPGSTDDNPWGNIQHFDIWQFQNADNDSDHFGKLPRPVAENLFWFFTEPGDLIIDPFAGAGITIDVAQAMGRRIWASDLTPKRDDIHSHDIATGWPDDAPEGAKLAFLDPPYWQQARAEYSNNERDLGNMELDAFYDGLRDFIQDAGDRLAPDGYLAFIISPSQCDDGVVIDHAVDLALFCADHGFEVERRIIVPYQTQQATGQQVDWARQHRKLLKLYRDLVVMRHV